MIRIRALTAVAVCSLAYSTAAHAQGRPFVRFEWDNAPSLRFGSFFRIDFSARTQVDVRRLSPEFPTDEGTFDVSRVRLGVEGEVFDGIAYQVEHEFRGELQERGAKYPWRDVWVNVGYYDPLQFRIGKFKVPFGMEALSGSSDLEFVNRARVSDDLAPGRDLGAVIHGRFGRALSYEAGAFRNDGENSDSSTDQRGGRTIAARITAQPLRLLSLPGDWDEVQIGGAVAESDVELEGLNTLRGRTVTGAVYFPHVHSLGRRLRVGAELDWRPGPFSIQGEWMQVQERRRQQSVRVTDLPAKLSRGWYLTATWAVTGESREDGRIRPRRAFLDGGWGALELAVRYEEILFRSTFTEGLAFRSTRAPNLLAAGERVWTGGVNWYLNRYARIQVNGIRERLLDPERAPVLDRERFYTGVVRFQVGF